MAVIPRYDNPTVQTVGLAIPQAQALGPEAFGAGLGAGLSKGGAVLGVIAAKEQEKADETVIADRKAKLLTEYNKISVGALATKGDAATGYTDAEGKIIEPVDQIALQDFDKKVSEIGMGLSERQAAKFRDTVNSHRAHLELSTMTHVIGQREAVRQEKLGSLAEIQYQTAAMAQTDAEKAQAVSDLQDTLSQRWADHSEEKYTETRDALWSKLHRGWIESTLEKDPTRGKAMYDEAVANGDLNKLDMDHMFARVQHVTVGVEGQALGDEVWKTYGPAAELASDKDNKYHGNILNVVTKPYDLEQQIMERTQGKPEQMRNTALSTLHAHLAAFEGQATRRDEETGSAILMKAREAWNAGRMLPTSSIVAMPEFSDLSLKKQVQVLDKTDAENQRIRALHRSQEVENRLLRNEENRAEAERQRVVQDTMQRTFDYWNTHPEELANLPKDKFNAIQAGVFDSDFKKLQGAREKLTDPKHLTHAVISQDTLNTLLHKAGITKPDDVRKYGDMARRYVQNLQKEEQRILKPEEIQAAVVQGLQQVAVNTTRASIAGIEYGSQGETKRRMEVKSPAAIVIPAGIQAKFDQVAKQRGVSLTPERRRKLYDELLKEAR